METTKFFIVNKHYHDFSALSKEPNSELIYLTENKVNVYHTERLSAEMKAKMSAAKITDRDFVVVCGAGILNVLAALAMKSIVGKVNVAIWNFGDKTYKKRFDI